MVMRFAKTCSKTKEEKNTWIKVQGPGPLAAPVIVNACGDVCEFHPHSTGSRPAGSIVDVQFPFLFYEIL